MHTTSLIFELAVQLWHLLGNPSIVGDKAYPAAWLPSIDGSSRLLCDVLSGMVQEIDTAVTSLITFLHDSGSFSQQAIQTDSEDAAAAAAADRLALMLAALTPAVPWQRIKEATSWDNLAFTEVRAYAKFAALQVQLCAHPLLRVVSMLASVGLLTEQHQQGVVALLGGGGPRAGSNNTNDHTADDSRSASGPSRQYSLLIPEPAVVSAHRNQHGISLAQLAVFVLWNQRKRLPEPDQQIRTITEHLLWAFGVDQLPSIARIKDYLMVQDLDCRTPFEYLDIPVAAVELWQQPSFKDTYLSWMQATLQGIVDEVLSEPRSNTI
jgi:hypothetical protein